MTESYIKQISRNQVARFVLSAGLGFLTNIACFSLFYRLVFLQKKYMVLGYSVKNYSLAVGVSFFLGVLVNFLMTRYIVFTESRTSFSKQFFRFLTVAVVGFFATQYILNFIITHFKVNPVLALVFTGFTLFAASYFIHKAFSFSLSLRKHVATDSTTGN
jgi:putative flippase GtrA